MDEYSGKRAIDGLLAKKGSSRVLRDTANSRDQNGQFCNRLGCSGRLNSTKCPQISSSEKPKSPRPSFRSGGKDIMGSSLRNCTAVSSQRKSFREPRKKPSSQLKTDSSETSSVQGEPEVSEPISPPGKVQRGLNREVENAEAGEITSMVVGSSSIASTTRPRRNLLKKSGLGNQNTLSGTSTSLASKSNNSQGVKHAANTSSYGLRNLRCNSISDVIPSGCSSSDFSLSRRKDVVKRRYSEGESSSSARGKKMTGPPLEDGRSSSSNHGISISDTRRSRTWAPSRDNCVASVRTRRSVTGNPRMRLSNQGNGNNLSVNDSSVVIPQMSEPEISITANAPSSSHQIFAENHPSCTNSDSRPGSSSESSRSRMPFGITRSLINRDSFQHYNMDGIAEVLLALERIEQDEELTYEQLLVLETNLFLNGLSFHDQHRDMRLDIDNMSYEELLALEERMGDVSTALTEEALANCLKRGIYKSKPPQLVIIGEEDDVKCTICQEEYVVGDEVGTLQCEHRYHVGCVNQWLRLKNWCPICKAADRKSVV